MSVSWWTIPKTRDEFSAKAREEQPRMSAAKPLYFLAVDVPAKRHYGGVSRSIRESAQDAQEAA